jgi:hypothetical protein
VVLSLQAVALVALAVALVVVSATSDLTIGVGFVLADVVGLVLIAALLTLGQTRRRARTPIALAELIAVLVSYQLGTGGRPWIAVAVGVPALVAFVLVVATNRPPDAST